MFAYCACFLGSYIYRYWKTDTLYWRLVVIEVIFIISGVMQKLSVGLTPTGLICGCGMGTDIVNILSCALLKMAQTTSVLSEVDNFFIFCKV